MEGTTVVAGKGGGRKMVTNKYTHPERANKCSSRRVPVVYYLCRNRQLEQPHFMEVPLSSPDGLFLRDVTDRLNSLRGRGIASMYSWSSKRSYKNGFVWHDLSDDDLIVPAHANEYVLKGSELFGDANSDRFAPIGTVKIQSLNQLPEPHASSIRLSDSSSSSTTDGKETKSSQVDGLSPESRVVHGKNSLGKDSLRLMEYKVYKSDRLASASTQTEEVTSRHASKETCTSVSTDEGALAVETRNESSEISENSVSPPLSISSSATSSSGGRTETLESLIRADVNKLNNSLKISEEDEEVRMPNNARIKATSVLMQLISCGFISVKDHSFGVAPTDEPRRSRSKFPSLLFSSSSMLGELDCLAENPSFMALRLDEKEYFSSRRITDCSSSRTLSKRLESLKQEESVFKIDERLASGARIIIQSKSPQTLQSF